MKKTLLILFVILFTGTALFAQSSGFKYQAVVRNASGAILQNQIVGLQISILQGSETGASVYSETWNIQTNDFGLVNLIIGEGSSSDNFSAISWGTNNYWVKIELDETGGTAYTEMGTSQLLSVPYSLYSTAPWSPSGDNIYYNSGNVGIGTSDPHARFEVQSTGFTGDTLFCVKDSKGQPVFIVYPDGVQVIVDTTSTKSGASGRFIISGRGFEKNSKGTELNFMDLTKKNYLIGHDVAPSLTPTADQGIQNSILGYEAGYLMETGYEHTFLGYRAGYKSIGGHSNVSIGKSAGFSSENGIGNVNIGVYAGYSNNHDPGSNVYIGHSSGYLNKTGTENVYIGYKVGILGVNGNNNIYLGSNTGKENEGSDNIFIGSNVGSLITNVSNMLYIDNSETLTPLIWGDFVNDILRINGSLNINNAYTFPVADGGADGYLKTDGSGNLYWSATKSLEESEDLILMKVTVEDQKSQIEKLIKENGKIKKDNKDFEKRLKTLEKLVNEK